MANQEYAWVLPNNQISRTSFFDGTPPVLAPSKGRWLPVVNVDVIYGPDISALVGPTLKIEPTRVTRGYDLRDKTAPEISQMVQSKMDEISSQFNLRAMAPIVIPTEQAGYQQFDADLVARNRVIGVLLLIVVCKLFGLPFPDSRPWTPYNSLSPVSMSPRDFVNLTLAVADREDKLFRRKKTLESNLIGISNNPAQVGTFDPTIGWEID